MTFTVSDSERQELACVYAALALYDDKAPVTGDNISKLLKAANVDVEPYWPKLFANLLANRDIGDLLLSSGAPAAGGAAPSTGAASSGAPAKEEKKKEEPKEEEEVDMGFSLFD